MTNDGTGEPSPFGTLRYAEDYRIAAERVIGDCSPLESRLLMPAYNLIAQSIELSLKAYLLSMGHGNRQLRGPEFGHKLNQLIAEAERLGLNNLVLLDDVDRQVVAELSAHYEMHEFRYIKIGLKRLPFWSLIAPLAKRFTHELHDYCLAFLLGEEGVRKRVETRGRF